MNTFTSKQLILFFGGLALFTALLVFGMHTVLNFIPASPSAAEPPSGASTPGSSENEVRTVNVADSDPRQITYTDLGFSPSTVTVKASDSLGCVITVRNKTNKVIHIGVSPHDPKGDPGANYGDLAPGEIGIYGVSYPGLTEVTLHNHLRPEHEFRVVYGEGCGGK